MTTRIFHSGTLKIGSSIVLEDSAAVHVSRVLRLGRGDALILFNGDGHDYSATITETSRNGVRVQVRAAETPERDSPLDIRLLQAVSRTQRMDWAIQKTTELGVGRIVPVICARSVVRLDARRRSTKLAHWQKVAASACEQSGRANLPQVDEAMELADALFDEAASAEAKILLDAGGTGDLNSTLDGARSVSLLVGPEGGLTDEETRLAERAGFVRIRLGPRVMRTETAPIAAISIIQYLSGDLRQSR